MKEKKLAKQKMANAEHKVRVATAFRGNRETDLELQVGDEVTVLAKVGHISKSGFQLSVVKPKPKLSL